MAGALALLTVHILAISNSWPGPRRLIGDVFFKYCLEELAANGHEIDVIAPRAWLRDPPAQRKDSILNVKEPRYLSFSNFTLPLGGNTLRWGQWFNARACRHAMRGQSMRQPDIVYGKFMSTCAAARSLSENLDVPWVVSVGESEWDWHNTLGPQYGWAHLTDHVRTASRIETVSRGLRSFLLSKFQVSPNRVETIPNGVQTDKFCPGVLMKARKELGLDPRGFYVAFTGRATVNKGAERLLEALALLPENLEVQALMLGVPSIMSEREGVAFAGEVAPTSMPLYLQAADVFVLPTTNEGMCNALLEAMAVGLPIVTSDLPFNREILDETCSLLVNPMDISALQEAILRLREDADLRQRLSRSARCAVMNFSIKKRAEQVEAFLLRAMRRD